MPARHRPASERLGRRDRWCCPARWTGKPACEVRSDGRSAPGSVRDRRGHANPAYLAAAKKWMLAAIDYEPWGYTFDKPNTDLAAGHLLYAKDETIFAVTA